MQNDEVDCIEHVEMHISIIQLGTLLTVHYRGINRHRATFL